MKKPKNIKTQIADVKLVTVDVDTAKWLLQYNVNNYRDIKFHGTKKWITRLKGGNFKTTHQGMSLHGDLDDPKLLLDGQHRLAAVIETGIPIDVFIHFNMPVNTREDIDDGSASRNWSERTGIPKKQVPYTNLIIELFKNDSYDKNPEDINFIHKFLKDQFEHIEKISEVKKLSVVPIKLAFMLDNIKRGITDYGNYQDFIEYSPRTESLKTLLKNVNRNDWSGSTGERCKLFVFVWKCLQKNDYQKKPALSKPIAIAQSIINEVLPDVYKRMRKKYTTRAVKDDRELRKTIKDINKHKHMHIDNDEVWKDIPKYEGYYQVSDKGRVRGLDRHVGKRNTFVKGRQLAVGFSIHKNRYGVVALSKDGYNKKYFVHTLMMMTFKRPDEWGSAVNYKDSDKFNLDLNNLEFSGDYSNRDEWKNGKTGNIVVRRYDLKY